MSDHKWDRFKRAFGAAPSAAIIDTRNGKVVAALTQATAALNQIAAAGLAEPALTARRNAIEGRRAAAMLLPDAAAKAAALDAEKDLARALAAEATTTAPARIAQLDQDLAAAKARVDVPVQAAKALMHPLCQAAVVAARGTVELAAGVADALPTKEARRAALAAIDIAPLQAANAGAKATDDSAKQMAPLMKDAPNRIGALLDSPRKTSVTTLHATVATAYAAVGAATDFAGLKRRIDACKAQVYDLAQKITDAVTILGGIPATMATFDANIRAAKAPAQALVDIGFAAVAAELTRVEDAAAAALLVADPEARMNAMGDVANNLQPLAATVLEARKVDSGATRMLTALPGLIAKVPDTGQKATFLAEYQTLQADAVEARGQDDIATVKADFAAIAKKLETLTTKVAATRGEAGFQEAVEQRFGITFTIQPGAITHMQAAYEALGQVPEFHTGHEKLLAIEFSADAEGGGLYKQSASKISVGNIKTKDTSPYIVDGRPVKPNSFNVTMLHEIGHSVDQKYQVMSGLMQNDAYGGWIGHEATAVAARFVTAAETAMGGGLNAAQHADVIAALEGAVAGTVPAKPAWTSRGQWTALKAHADIAINCREEKKPWFKQNHANVKVGDRVYFENEKGNWNSFTFSTVAALKVNDYQWRSPAEFFAEIYAISWMQKRKVPGNVGDAVGQYLPA